MYKMNRYPCKFYAVHKQVYMYLIELRVLKHPNSKIMKEESLVNAGNSAPC